MSEVYNRNRANYRSGIMCTYRHNESSDGRTYLAIRRARPNGRMVAGTEKAVECKIKNIVRSSEL